MVKVLLEDPDLIVAHKPAGWTVYSEAGAGKDLQSQLKNRVRGPLFPVHRLDRGTCGLVVFGRSQMSAQKLQNLFLKRQVKKTYWAIAGGEVTRELNITTPLKTKEGKEQSAQTRFVPLLEPWREEDFAATLLRCEPKTGRFHQIRRHLKEAGHPILGDSEYGKEPWNHFAAKRWKVNRALLSAVELSFTHPRTHRPIHVRTLPDPDFRKVLDSWGMLRE
jgi:tRNA pseudouridine65 synthase